MENPGIKLHQDGRDVLSRWIRDRGDEDLSLRNHDCCGRVYWIPSPVHGLWVSKGLLTVSDGSGSEWFHANRNINDPVWI
jgi:hypothetical protein